MENELLPVLSTVIISFITALITWGFTRKKQEQETISTELDNVEKATQIWRELAQDLKKQIDQLQKEMNELKKEVHTYRKENQQLKRTLKTQNA